MARLLKEALKDVLAPEQILELESGIDIVGDIAILRLGESLKGMGSVVGEATLKALKNVKVVLNQEGQIEGEYRLRKLLHLAGEKRTLTIHKENNCRFKVDVQTCYFSPRLSTERLRVADAVKDGEAILNMFAGVGPYSITIARRREAQVSSNELNRAAYELHVENNKMNKVSGKITTLNLDAAKLPSQLSAGFDRIIMPHPSGAMDYLGAAKELLNDGGLIYYYRHVTAPDPEEGRMALQREVDSILGEAHASNIRKVRAVGPRLIEMVAEIRVRS